MSKARVTISKISRNGNPSMQISIEDELSGETFVTVELTLEDFAHAITGQAFIKADMRLGDLEMVGKKREMKQEIVSVKNTYPTYKELAKLARPFEVDGWQHSLYEGAQFTVGKDKKTGALSFSIPFVRWVNVV